MSKIEREREKARKKKYEVEKSLTMIPFFEYLYELYNNHILSDIEYSSAKYFLLTYKSERIIDDYKTNFLDAIPLLYDLYQKKDIDDKKYHKAVEDTTHMKNDMYLARLLHSGLISYVDYNNHNRSKIVRRILDEKLMNCGFISPTDVALRLTENFDFYVVESSINFWRQKVVLKKGSEVYITKQRFINIFSTKKNTILDKNGNECTYREIEKKLQKEI